MRKVSKKNLARLIEGQSKRLILGLVPALIITSFLAYEAVTPKIASPSLERIFVGWVFTSVRIGPDASPSGDLSRCRAEIARLEKLPALPGTPKLDAQRAALLAQHKAEPVVFLREPEYAHSSNPVVRAHRRRLAQTRFPADVIRQSIERYAHRPDLGRQVLLREGYLYADNSAMLRGLNEYVRVEQLFDATKIQVQRGDVTHAAVRDPVTRKYTYEDGPNAGQRVKVLPFDRIVSSPDELRDPIHRSFRALRNDLGFERMLIQRMTTEGIVADLRYADLWVPTVLDGEGAGLHRVCEAVDPAHRERVDEARSRAEQRLRLVQKVREVALQQVREALPFDEPKTEYGQQDGMLRPRWETAYADGQPGFRYQGDWYPVFGADGHPAVPQVCLDFLLDTLERAGGSWWRPNGQPRERTMGRFDRASLELANPRSIDQFIGFATSHPEQVDLLSIPPAELIEFRHAQRFLAYLERNAAEFVPGDIVIIRGYIPRPGDRRHDIMHYHSAFVYETDPVTGVPTLLIGNSGVPRLTTWRYEMMRTPRRSVRHRIRLHPQWLSTFIDPAAGPIEPVPIVAGGRYGVE